MEVSTIFMSDACQTSGKTAITEVIMTMPDLGDQEEAEAERTKQTTASTSCYNASDSSNEEGTEKKLVSFEMEGLNDTFVDDCMDPFYLARVEKYKFQAMKYFRRLLGEDYDETLYDEVIPPTDSEDEDEGEAEIDFEKISLEAKLVEELKLKLLQDKEQARTSDEDSDNEQTESEESAA